MEEKKINIKETKIKIVWDIMLISICVALGLVNRLSYIFLAFSAVLCFPFFKDFTELLKAQPEEKKGLTTLTFIGLSALVISSLAVLATLIFAKIGVLVYVVLVLILVMFLPSVVIIFKDYIKRKKLSKQGEKYTNPEVQPNFEKDDGITCDYTSNQDDDDDDGDDGSSDDGGSDGDDGE